MKTFTKGRSGLSWIALLVGACAALVLAVPASAGLKIHESVRTEPMSQDNDAVIAPCPKGEAPISGGFRTPSFDTPLFVATASFLGDGGWQASAQRRLGDLEDGSITSFASCSKLGKKVESRGETTSLEAGSSANLTASCKRSETLLSGVAPCSARASSCSRRRRAGGHGPSSVAPRPARSRSSCSPTACRRRAPRSS